MTSEKKQEAAPAEKALTPAPSEKHVTDYVLVAPLEFEGRRIEAVTLRRLKGRDMLAVESEISARVQGRVPGDLERSYYLVARSAGIPVEAVEEMDAADATALVARVGTFF